MSKNRKSRKLSFEQLGPRDMLSASPWQNPDHPNDVNGDGFLDVVDAVVLINDLVTNGPRTLVIPPEVLGPDPDPRVDVNGDDRVGADDAILVINALLAGDTVSARDDFYTLLGESTADVLSVLENDLGARLLYNVAGAQHGTASVSPDGREIIYSRDPNFAGDETLTYTINDGHGNFDTATVNLTIYFTETAFDAQLSAIHDAHPRLEQGHSLDLTKYEGFDATRDVVQPAEQAIFDIINYYQDKPGIAALALPSLPASATDAVDELTSRLNARRDELQAEIQALSKPFSSEPRTSATVAEYEPYYILTVEFQTLELLQQDLQTLESAKIEEAVRVAATREAALHITIEQPELAAPDASAAVRLEVIADAKPALIGRINIRTAARQTALQQSAEAKFAANSLAAEKVANEIAFLITQDRAALASLEAEESHLRDIIAHPLDHIDWDPTDAEFGIGTISGSFGRPSLSTDESLLIAVESGSVVIRDVHSGDVVQTWNVPGVRSVVAAAGGTFWTMTIDTVALRSLETGEVLWQEQEFDFNLQAMTATRDGSVVAVKMSRSLMVLRRSGNSATRTDFAFADNLQSDMHFNADGSILAVPMQGTLVLLETDTGVRYEFEGFRESLSATAWSHDGTMVAAGDFKGFVQIIDVPTKQVIGSFQMPFNYYVGAIAFSPNQALLVTGDPNVGLMFWDITQLDNIQEYDRSTEERSLAYFQLGSSGNTLLARNDSGIIAYSMPEAGRGEPISRETPPILDPVSPTPDATPDDPAWQQSGSIAGTLGTATSGRYSVLTPDGQHFVTADGGNSVRIVDVATGAVTQTVVPNSPADFAALSSGGEQLYYVGTNPTGSASTVVRLDINSGNEAILQTLTTLRKGTAIDVQHHVLAIGEHAGGSRVLVIDLQTGASVQIPNSENNSEAVAISESGRYVAVGRTDGGVVVYDRQTGQSRTMVGLTREVRTLAWTHGTDAYLAAADDNARVAMFAPQSSTMALDIFSIPYDSDPSTGLAFSNNNLLLFRGANANGLLALDASNVADLRVYAGMAIVDVDAAHGLTLSLTGRTLYFSGNANNTTIISALAVPAYGLGPADPNTTPPVPPSPEVPALDSTQQNELAAPTTVETLNASQRQHLLNSVTAYFSQRVSETGLGGTPWYYLQQMEHNPALLGLNADSSYRDFFQALAADMQTKWPLQNPPQLDALAGGSGTYVPPSDPVIPPAPTPEQTQEALTAEELVLTLLRTPVNLAAGTWVRSIDPISNTHIGLESNAVDLNMVVDANDSNPFADRGQPVYAPMAGVVTELDREASKLVIRSTATMADGSTIRVFIVMRHLKIDDGLSIGSAVKLARRVGSVDLITDGTQQSSGGLHIRPHLHMSIHLGSLSAPSLDLTSWLQRNQINDLIDPDGGDTGGSVTNSQLVDYLYSLSSYRPNFYVNDDTLAGRMFLGYLRGFAIESQGGDVTPLARLVERLTGIHRNTVLDASPFGNSDARAAALKTLFIRAQYGHIFYKDGGNELHVVTDKFEGSSGTVLDTYHDFASAVPGAWTVDTRVRVRFDAALSRTGSAYHHGHVYVIDAQTGQQIGGALTAEIKDKLYVDIPLATLAAVIGDEFQQGGPSGPGGALVVSGRYKIMIVLWKTSQDSPRVADVTETEFRFEHLAGLPGTAPHADLTDLVADGQSLSNIPHDRSTVGSRSIVSPQLTAVLGPDGRSAILNWNSVAEVHQYKIYVFSADNRDGVHLFVDSDTTTATIEGLRPGNTYYFGIRALDDAGDIYPSEAGSHGGENVRGLFVDPLPGITAVNWLAQQPAQRDLQNYLLSVLPGIRVQAPVVLRFVKPNAGFSERLSEHATAKAVDIFFGPGETYDMSMGDAVYAALVRHGEALGIEGLPLWRDGGLHENHIHVGFTAEGSQNTDFSILALDDLL